jgi:hypothetical protein
MFRAFPGWRQSGIGTWNGGHHYRRLVLPIRKHWWRSDDIDGNRSGPSEAIQHINYALRKDIKKLSRDELERAQISNVAMQTRT